jgi:glucan endo-1,3-beta-D-glucosidase
MRFSHIYALAASIATVRAQYKGFNYGSTNVDGSIKDQAHFEQEFTTAQNLAGAPGFTSARLYTMIQGGTTNTPISAIQAAINTDTSLLLGLWASAGQSGMDNEIAALKAAISQYGTAFTNLIVGISVGSEDLYRNSPTGAASNAGPGLNPDALVNYISQVRSAISGTAAASAPVGHVDTWSDWTNGTNSAVINAVDFIGMDAYPYYETGKGNDINNAQKSVIVSRTRQSYILISLVYSLLLSTMSSP